MLCFFLITLSVVHSNSGKSAGGSMYCCDVEREHGNVAVFINEGNPDKTVSLDPNVDAVFSISRRLRDHSINFSITKERTAFVIAPKDFSEQNYSIMPPNSSRFGFLYASDYVFGVYSIFGCVDSVKICFNNLQFDPFMALVLAFIPTFLVIAIFFNPFAFRFLSDNVWFFDEDLRTIFAPPRIPNRRESESLEALLAQCASTKQYFSSTIRQFRGVGTSSFDRTAVFIVDGKKQMYMCILWREELPKPNNDPCPINVRLESETKELISSAEVYLKSFREFRPVRVHFELTSGQRGVLELPVGVITPLQPLAHIFSIITSIFLDCSVFLTINPYSCSNVTQILQKYFPMIGANQAFFFDINNELFNEFHLQSSNHADPKILQELVAANPGKSIIDCNDISGVKWIYVLTTDTSCTRLTIIFCFPGPRNSQFAVFGMPVVGLCVAFICQISLARQVSLKYMHLIDMLVQSKVFSFYEFNMKSKKLQLVRDDCRDILGGDASDLIKFAKPGELVTKHNDDNMIYIYQTSDSEKEDSVINILVEDLHPIVSHIADMTHGTITTMEITETLGLHKIFTKGCPSLLENDNLLVEFGYEHDTKLIDCIHKQDLERFRILGQKFDHFKGSTFNEIAASTMVSFDGAEKRFTPTFSQITKIIDQSSSQQYEMKCNSESMLFRIVDKSKAAHWFVAYGNADIGFIFSAKTILSGILPPLSLKALSNAQSSVIIWGVLLASDHVVPVFDMPTIWDELCIDKETPFSNFIKFFRDPSPEVEAGIHDVCGGKIQSYTNIVYILRPGGVIRRGRISLTRIKDSLICAFLDLEDYSETASRVKEQRQIKSFLMKAGNMGLWRFYDDNDKADNEIVTGEGIMKTLNWSFVDKQIEDPETHKLFTTRMRNAMDLGHAFEIDMKLKNGQYVALRGRQTSRHIVTGLCIDISAIYQSPTFRLVNGKSDILDTVKAVEEVRSIFASLDRTELTPEQCSAIDEVISASDEIIARIPQ